MNNIISPGNEDFWQNFVNAPGFHPSIQLIFPKNEDEINLIANAAKAMREEAEARNFEKDKAQQIRSFKEFSKEIALKMQPVKESPDEKAAIKAIRAAKKWVAMSGRA